MTIPELKSCVDIQEVGKRLGISIDSRSKKALCPFHNDKDPSLQFSEAKQIATCFSSNCNVGSMDSIKLIEKKLQLNTHEACEWLKSNFVIQESQAEAQQRKEVLDLERNVILKHSWDSFFMAMRGSKNARDYLQVRGLNYENLEVGFYGGKLHHGKTAKQVEQLRQVGLVTKTKFGHVGFGMQSLVFPMKNKAGEIVSFYFRLVEPVAEQHKSKLVEKHLYLKNRQGLYPCYPSSETKRLILTESIIDTATLNTYLKGETVLACYGTNGLSAEHIEVIKELKDLEEVVFWFDADASGNAAVTKYSESFKQEYPNLKITKVEMPEGEDINSLLESHEVVIYKDLFNQRSILHQHEEQLIISPEVKSQETKKSVGTPGLDITNPNKIRYSGAVCAYVVKGGIRKEWDSMRVSLLIEHIKSGVKSRVKLDLYEDKQSMRVAKEVAERLNERSDLIESELYKLTELLDEHKEQTMGVEEKEQEEVEISAIDKSKCLEFLKRPNLINRINELIGKAGVVGEENNRIFLFGIASSYKMEDTLHALIQGSSGSGKTHLLNTIIEFMPDEDTEQLTRVTESSFYNYDEYELKNKLIGIEDIDGLEEKAQLAFRELQSKGMLSSSTSGKDELTGQIKGYVKKVYGPIASLSATTQGEIYEDNMSRCFLVAVDESKVQTLKIIEYQNCVAAGAIKKDEQKEIKHFLQNSIRLLKNEKVVNPFAGKISLPPQAHKIRRLNDLFQCYVKQVTLLNQYQRSRTKSGEVVTSKEDVIIAIEIMFESILLKVDELDGSLRQYYESLKEYVERKGNRGYEFTRLEVRKEFNISKTQQHRHMDQLMDLEYVYQEGYANRGYKYKVVYWDDNKKQREEIRDYLLSQVQAIKGVETLNFKKTGIPVEH